MKKQLLKEIIEKKGKKVEFAIITDLENGESCVFEKLVCMLSPRQQTHSAGI